MKEFKDDLIRLYSKEDRFLHNIILSCGREIRVNHSYSWDGNGHGDETNVIWQYTIAGKGAIDFEDKHFELNEGQSFLVTLPGNYRYYLPKNSHYWEFLFIAFTGNEALRLAEEFIKNNGSVFNLNHRHEIVVEAQNIIDNARKGIWNDRYLTALLAYGFMMKLLAFRNHDDENFKFSNLLEKAKNYCIHNISGNITVDDMAKAANISRWHFSRLFKELEGKSPHQYILETRMQLASQLLKTGKFSNKDIATKCGYDDDSYFCKVFKSFYSVTPNQYRGK